MWQSRRMTAHRTAPPTRVVVYHIVAPLGENGALGSADGREMGMGTPPKVLAAHVALLKRLGIDL
jgi:hypothetical protein